MSTTDDTFSIGTKVKILSDPESGPGPWPAQPTGTIISDAEIVDGRNGPLNTYWVQFDEPQYDTDRSGPYSKSQVLEKYLMVQGRS